MSAAGTQDPMPASSSESAPFAAAESPYGVSLPIFEGPLDLLLHLIRANEVDITDIPIAVVADQYVQTLELMRDLHLDVAGEYLVMAATLAWIKSRMLLPPDPSALCEEAGDPRAELVARLLEYQRFKEAAGELAERPWLGRDVFAARTPGPEREPEAEREIEVGLFQLVDAMRRVLAQEHTGAAHEVEIETVTVHQRMLVVMEALSDREACEFEELVREDGAWASRPTVVATFLAILELTRLEAIGLYQGLDDTGAPCGPIHVRRHLASGPGDWLARLSERM